MESKPSSLSIDPNHPKGQPARLNSDTRGNVADSWEDEVTSDTGADSNDWNPKSPAMPDAPPPTPSSPSSASPLVRGPKSPAMPDAPPPTPSSPSSAFPLVRGLQSPHSIDRRLASLDSEDRSRRPEKSTAVAGRLIAAGLGVRPPKKSEEQQAYEKVVAENETKRKAKQKEARDREQQDKEKATTEMWES